MTKEKEKLLELDISYRLPFHKLIVKWGEENFNILDIGFGRVTLVKPLMSITSGAPLIHEVKPYLRPLSSMTEEEKEELRLEHEKDERLFIECINKSKQGDNSMRGKVITHYAADWCNKNNFDYRGLIPMNLALEAPEGMY